MEATSKVECDVEKEKEDAEGTAIRSTKVCTDDMLDGTVTCSFIYISLA